MHHMYSSKKGDPLCPLGFHPQVRWPTRCKRCFRDYKDHGDKRGSFRDVASSTPNLSPSSASSERPTERTDGRRSWASTTSLTKDDFKPNFDTDITVNTTSMMNLNTCGKDDDDDESRSSSRQVKTIKQQQEKVVPRRRSSDADVDFTVERPSKLQIKEVIQNSDGTSGNDVEFIIQVKKSLTRTLSTNDIRNTDNGSEKNEIRRLRSQLNDMKERCEKAEKEKSEILLRRLTTMETISNKTSASEMSKLEKSLKDTQGKVDSLTEEKAALLRKMKDFERETHYKLSKNERDRTYDDLKSKLKAAENLCESLMDENEDMKKEIRELEEEICEMQDNFREEQASEYTTLRKSLEQSNKNCRILSFKLRKLERTNGQLQNDKNEFEKKFEEVKKITDMLTKIRNDYKKKSDTKAVEYATKVQVKKMADEMEKEIAEIITLCGNINDGKDVDMANIKTKENSMKYETLLHEYELLKEKLESTAKELSQEKEKEKKREKEQEKDKGKDKYREGKVTDDKMNVDFQNMKKKLDYTVTSRETEKKAWDEEKEKLKSKLLSLSDEKLKIYNELIQVKKDFETAKTSEKEYVNKNKKGETTINNLKKELSQEKKRCKELQNDLLSSTQREGKMTDKITSVEQAKMQLDAETKRLKEELESAKSSNAAKLANLNAELVQTKKDKDNITSQSERDKTAKESEVATLKTKIASLERSGLDSTKIKELKANHAEKMSNLEKKLDKIQEDYDKLNEKHKEMEKLNEQSKEENQNLNSTLILYQKDLMRIQVEMEALHEVLMKKENEWQTEKSTFEERIKEYEKLSHKPLINELNNEINGLKKENSFLLERLENAREINEDLTNKLKDYDAVSKAHQVLAADTTALETEIQKMKNTVATVEKAKKADIAQCKMHFEQRITAINDEMQSLQNQLSRYKRERDTYKHMLEGAQKTIADLKSIKQRRSNSITTKSDEDEETTRSNIALLEQQISCMEDELSETKLESSRLKTSLVSEKSAWNVKLAEMQSRINELEEERVLSSGRAKVQGVKVKMELAWQKERKEQQRLLEETATLARDLRQTLFEIERERAKERLENKRRQDQLKKAFDEEKDENKKKLIELQCDLLELRDAHAKLRTSNERMRREKERHEKERQELKNEILSQRGLDENGIRNFNALLRQVDELQKLLPEVSELATSEKPNSYTPTPPRRSKGPKSRESSPMLETKNDTKGNASPTTEKKSLQETIERLTNLTKELKETKVAFEATSARQIMKLGKRATSVDNDAGRTMRNGGTSRAKPRLKVKSLSLEQTSGRNVESQNIWGTDSNMSSMQSLESENRAFSLQRDSSVDSRLSGGSTKSEMLHREKKYNKGIIRKLTTKLVKSSSVDDANMSLDYQTSGSELSIPEDNKVEKKNLKKKLTDMFKRTSRSSSADRRSESRNSSRPSSRNSMVAKA